MSGIFGIVTFIDEPPDLDRLERMATAMQPWGRDGITTAARDGAAFGQALTRSTPEDVHTRMPAAWDEAGVLFTAAGRLDNRDDLLAELGIAPADAPALTDTDVMLRAFRRWGEECAPRLFGDWALAAWSSRDRRLFLSRDHHGNTALHVYRDPSGGAVAFASDRRALHAAGAPRGLNEAYLAELLVSWSVVDGAETIDAAITRVPPAHTYVATEAGTRSTRYWFPEHAPELHLGSLEDYADGLHAVYDAAVRTRLRSADAVGVTLSGGLDSGSVAVLAARALRERGEPLHAYTHVPLTDTSQTVGRSRFGDERAYSASTARFAGIADHQLLDSAGVSPIDGIERSLQVLDQPTHAASNAFWMQDILATAHAQGVRTLLTGQGGNATVSWTGRPASSSLTGRIRAKGLRGGVGYLFPLWLQRRRMTSVLAAGGWATTSINPGFATRIDLAARCGAVVGRSVSYPGVRATSQQMRAAITQPGSARVGDIWAMHSAFAGIDVRDPTADARVIEYVYSVPDAVFTGPAGSDRVLIRTAMAGLMPDDVRLNHDRGRQSADLAARLVASAPQVDTALASLASGPAGDYVDLDRLRRTWDETRGDPSPLATHRAGSILLRGMMAGLWINRAYG